MSKVDSIQSLIELSVKNSDTTVMAFFKNGTITRVMASDFPYNDSANLSDIIDKQNKLIEKQNTKITTLLTVNSTLASAIEKLQENVNTIMEEL